MFYVRFFFINAHFFSRTQLGRKTKVGCIVLDWYLLGCYSMLVSGWMATSRRNICLHLQSHCWSGWFVITRSPTDIMWRFYWCLRTVSGCGDTVTAGTYTMPLRLDDKWHLSWRKMFQTKVVGENKPPFLCPFHFFRKFYCVPDN